MGPPCIEQLHRRRWSGAGRSLVYQRLICSIEEEANSGKVRAYRARGAGFISAPNSRGRSHFWLYKTITLIPVGNSNSNILMV
jgi:hypothetical protein